METWQIRMKAPPGDRVKFVRALRLIGNMGLKPAADLANHLDNIRNSVVVAGLQPDVAAHIANQLRDAGALVTLEASSIDTPMLCCPAAGRKFEWSLLHRVKRVATGRRGTSRRCEI